MSKIDSKAFLAHQAGIAAAKREFIEFMMIKIGATAKAFGAELSDENRELFGALSSMTLEPTELVMLQIYEAAREYADYDPMMWIETRERFDQFINRSETVENHLEVLGLSVRRIKTVQDRTDVLMQCAEYYCVPQFARQKVDELVTSIAMRGSQATFFWINAYDDVVNAIVAACLPRHAKVAATV